MVTLLYLLSAHACPCAAARSPLPALSPPHPLLACLPVSSSPAARSFSSFSPSGLRFPAGFSQARAVVLLTSGWQLQGASRTAQRPRLLTTSSCFCWWPRRRCAINTNPPQHGVPAEIAINQSMIIKQRPHHSSASQPLRPSKDCMVRTQSASFASFAAATRGPALLL